MSNSKDRYPYATTCTSCDTLYGEKCCMFRSFEDWSKVFPSALMEVFLHAFFTSVLHVIHQLHSWWKSPRFALNVRLDGPQNKSWSLRTEKRSLAPAGKRTIILPIWCDFDRASSLICGNKMPTRCNRGFYWRSYCLLNMFRAPLCPSW